MANISNEMVAYVENTRKECEHRIELAMKHYEAGKCDCNQGIYNKWYRYHTEYGGRAYDLGWVEQNKQTQNEKVLFIKNN